MKNLAGRFEGETLTKRLKAAITASLRPTAASGPLGRAAV
jgi:hypothetical protein